MDQFLHFLTETTTAFGMDVQNWMLMAGGVLVIWIVVLVTNSRGS